VERGLILANITVLLDGWALAYEPDSPAAVHLQTLLDYWPPEIRAVAALPGQALESIPGEFENLIVDTSPTAAGRLRWEQWVLPILAKKTGAQIVHLTSGAAALFGTSSSIFSPAGHMLPKPLAEPGSVSQSQPVRYNALAYRLRAALMEGGLSRLRGILWPADLPGPGSGLPVYRLPVTVPKIFWEENSTILNMNDLDLPDDYVLYHGSADKNTLRRVLDGWSWVNHALGEATRLLAAGLDGPGRERLAGLAKEYDLAGSVRVLPDIPMAKLVEIYQRSRGLFHPAAISPWGDPLHLALVCGKPVVALESNWADARLGSAGYLVPPDGRALGAALVTILVEDEISQSLSVEAKKRLAIWKTAKEQFRRDLSETYQELAGYGTLSVSH